MFAHLFRSVKRQTFKCIQNQSQSSHVKRFYANHDSKPDSGGDEDTDGYTAKNYYRFCDFDETSRVYEDYYRRYYDNYKNKFDSNRSDRQTDDKSDDNGCNDEKKRFKSNSYSFSECNYHLLTLKLLENIGFIGATIFVGLHSRPFYTNRYAIRGCDPFEGTIGYRPKPSTGICGDCKYCQTLLSKLLVLSAPIKKNYVLSKFNDRFQINGQNSDNVNKDLKEENKSQQNSRSRVENKSDPIDDICRQLQNASIDYIDRLNNMLGIALIDKQPEEAMKCWSSTKSSSKALFNMGVAFETGKYSTAGEVDLKKAYEHYALSASMGHKLAIYNLSLFYLYGKGGIPVDLNRAEKLLRRARMLGVEPAQQFIDKLDHRKTDQIKDRSVMRSSASAPNLTDFFSCFESFNNENTINNKYQQNYRISYRV